MTTSSTSTTGTGSGSASTLAGLLSNNASGLVGLAALASILGPSNSGTGYAGTVNNNLGLVRGQLPGVNPVNSQAYGQNYFTNPQYVDVTNTGAVTNAIQNMQTQAATQQAQNAANVAQPPTTPPSMAMPWANAGKPVQAVTPFTNTQPAATPSGIASPSQIQAMQAQLANLQQNPAQIINAGKTVQAASGGIMTGMAHGGQYLQGSTDGMADKLNTSIDGTQPARLSHGEFVVPADVVSHLGNGNSDAGAQHLYKMMDKIREARTGTKKQGKRIDPNKFTPGGIAEYSTGGNVQRFDGGGTTATPTASSAAGQTTGTSVSSTLSPYVGQYVTNMLGQGQALANTPMPVYTGQLTAGPSALQNQQFAGLSQLAQTGLTPTQFTSGTFDANAAAQYMNPYLQASLNPQLQALQLAAQQGEQGDLSKLTQAGAYGGTRQAVLQGQDAYNLLAQQGNLIGQGYNTAYNNAMNQFNTANAQSLQAQQNQEAANEAAANYGLSTLNALGAAGNVQQGLAQAADTAALNQFNTQAQYPYQQLNFESNLLNGLPIGTTTSTANNTTLGNILNTAGGLGSLYNILNSLGSGSSGGSGGSGSSGVTSTDLSNASAGTTLQGSNDYSV